LIGYLIDYYQDIYQALRNSPAWNETAFVITYDEHGGFYDHVPPPDSGVPSPDGIVASNGFQFDRLGIRIPTVAISPRIKRGTVVHDPSGPTSTSRYDSTSIMATANQIFGISEHLTQRDAWAGTFESIFQNEVRTDCPETIKLEKRTTKSLRDVHTQPPNDHQLIQIEFYCKQNQITDPNCGKGLVTQRDVVAWLEEQICVFEERILPHVRLNSKTKCRE
jgi:phospholipase C